jgi:hypothetical protein
MKVESFQIYNPDTLIKFKLGKRLTDSYLKTDNILRWAEELRPDIIMEFIEVFQRRISEVIGDRSIEIDWNQISSLIDKMDYLKNNPEFTMLLTRYIITQLELPNDFGNLDQEIEVTSFNHARENERLRYYLAKGCPDILGEDEGVEFWKDIISLMLRDERIDYEAKVKENPKAEDITPIELSERSIKWWNKISIGDFTRVIFDDHKILYRFDKCITPEVLKDLNDPKWAYLSSCYIGDAPNYNFGVHFLRRTQTLHTALFCDELYWDPRVHDDPEQPSLEFTSGVEGKIDKREGMNSDG